MTYQTDLVFSCGENNSLPACDVWIVIDVLRATTVMTRWFELGGKMLYPVKNPEAAKNLFHTLKEENNLSPLLMGEINGLRPEGFDLGNSPLDLNHEIVSSHSCGVMSTTNGTVALNEANLSGNPVIASSFRNFSACLDYAKGLGFNIGLLCSGRKKRPSWEDALCAGAIIEELNSSEKTIMTDSAKIALNLWQNRNKNLLECVMQSEHAQYLEKIGFANDIAFACELNQTNVVPMLNTDEKSRVILFNALESRKER